MKVLNPLSFLVVPDSSIFSSQLKYVLAANRHMTLIVMLFALASACHWRLHGQRQPIKHPLHLHDFIFHVADYSSRHVDTPEIDAALGRVWGSRLCYGLGHTALFPVSPCIIAWQLFSRKFLSTIIFSAIKFMFVRACHISSTCDHDLAEAISFISD
ncbi:MAG: hypothetical protein WBG19_09600 [Thermoplasmata archaeon]